MSPRGVITGLPGNPHVYSGTDAGLESSKELKFPGELEQEWSPQLSAFIMVIISAAWLKWLHCVYSLSSLLKVIMVYFYMGNMESSCWFVVRFLTGIFAKRQFIYNVDKSIGLFHFCVLLLYFVSQVLSYPEIMSFTCLIFFYLFDNFTFPLNNLIFLGQHPFCWSNIWINFFITNM